MIKGPPCQRLYCVPCFIASKKAWVGGHTKLKIVYTKTEKNHDPLPMHVPCVTKCDPCENKDFESSEEM